MFKLLVGTNNLDQRNDPAKPAFSFSTLKPPIQPTDGVYQNRRLFFTVDICNPVLYVSFYSFQKVQGYRVT